MFTRIARQKSELLQFPAQFGIKFDQRPGNTEASSPGLTRDPAAIGQDQDIKFFGGFRRQQRLFDVGARQNNFQMSGDSP